MLLSDCDFSDQIYIKLIKYFMKAQQFENLKYKEKKQNNKFKQIYCEK